MNHIILRWSFLLIFGLTLGNFHPRATQLMVTAIYSHKMRDALGIHTPVKFSMKTGINDSLVHHCIPGA